MEVVQKKSKNIFSPTPHFLHKIELRLGEWKKKYEISYVNSLIAIALNHCVKDSELTIHGYLITKDKVYLVAKTVKEPIIEILDKIEIHLCFLLQEHTKSYYAFQKPFFKTYPLKNDYLVQLITGKKVELPYHDRELEELKFIIKHSSFCSCIDYSGALGPVDVTLLED
jgi:hypothetical protein